MGQLYQFSDYEEDIKGRWSEEYLRYAVLWGVFQGDDQNRLRPRAEVTREEMAAVIFRVLLSEPQSRTVTTAMEQLVYIQAKKEEGTGIGSGFWLDGWRVVTNAHVAYNRDQSVAEAVYVFGQPGAGFHPIEGMEAHPLAVDHLNDLALLQVDKPRYAEHPDFGDLPTVTLSERDPAYALHCWALGHPRAQSWDVCHGIIRHPERFINYWQRHQKVLALDVPINPGNSGGMLINLKGRVIGVPAAGIPADKADSMTYAIPVSKVKSLLA